jgi:hypothetical protein
LMVVRRLDGYTCFVEMPPALESDSELMRNELGV